MGTADFVFQGGSSSLLATAGHSADGRNVALWDTLLPQRKACVTAFNCHDAGAACLAHATQHQLLLSAGKKGLVCLWDLRQGRLLHTFRAHEHAVKCIAMDSNETMFVTGSADGDIKVHLKSINLLTVKNIIKAHHHPQNLKSGVGFD